MPELAEVEFGAALARKTLLGATIEKAEVFEDTKVLVNVKHTKLKRVLAGAQLESIRRIGKYIEWSILQWPKGGGPFRHDGVFPGSRRRCCEASESWQRDRR